MYCILQCLLMWKYCFLQCIKLVFFIKTKQLFFENCPLRVCISTGWMGNVTGSLFRKGVEGGGLIPSVTALWSWQWSSYSDQSHQEQGLIHCMKGQHVGHAVEEFVVTWKQTVITDDTEHHEVSTSHNVTNTLFHTSNNTISVIWRINNTRQCSDLTRFDGNRSESERNE